MRFNPLLVCTALAVLPCSSAKLQAQGLRDTATAVIHAGKIFDSEKGVFQSNVDIVVRRGRIMQVGTGLRVPPGAKEIDLRNYTVIPGLIDMHSHVAHYKNPNVKPELLETIREPVVEGGPLRVLHAAGRLRSFLEAGFTTVRDLGNSGQFLDVALARAIDDGSIVGPRIIPCGPGLSAEGGQFPGLQKQFREIAEEEYRTVTSPWDGAAAVRENVTYGARCIKIYSNSTPNPGSLSVEEMTKIMEEARRMNVTVAAHATDDASVYRAALAGVTTIEHVYNVSDSTLALMARRGIAMTPTDIDSLRFVKAGTTMTPAMISRSLEGLRDRLRRAVKAGVMIVAGSDTYMDSGIPVGESSKNMFRAYQGTLTPVQILQAATFNAAKAMNRQNMMGVIRPGAFADLVALGGDAAATTDALFDVRWVMKEGTIYLERQ